jgi:hypothetical protein
MKVYAAELLTFFTSVSLNLLQLIMHLVALHKTITTGLSTKAHHNLEIFRKLSESIWHKLVNLYMKLNQNIGQDWVQWHPKTCSKKIHKHENFIGCWFRNDLLPWLTCRAFSKISQSPQLSDAADGYG